jgi:hypothetical protein
MDRQIHKLYKTTCGCLNGEQRTGPLVLGSTNLYLVLFLMQPLLRIAYQNSICLCDNRGRGQERRWLEMQVKKL